MRYYLAIDQGGSKTDAVVFTERGEILSSGNDRDIRRYGEDYQDEQAHFIRRAAEAALEPLGRKSAEIALACGALNGADWPQDYERLTRLTARALNLPESRVRVLNDCIGAMRGGTAEKRCGSLCIGSGLNCAVRNERGETFLYGYFIADCDQGGGALGRAAWRAAVEQWTGLGPPTRITDILLETYRKPDLEALYIAFTTGEMPLHEMKMAPLLMRAAAADDPVALAIIDGMAERLGRYVALAMKRLDMAGGEMTLVISGGVTKGQGALLTRAIAREIARLEAGVRCVSAPYEPVAGTALCLLDEIYPEGIPEAVMARFRADAEKLGLMRFRTDKREEITSI